MENNFDLNSPVIITGRGGSGTRLVSKLLESLPVYIGENLNESGDSLDWVGPSRDIMFEKANVADGTFDDFWIQRITEHATAFISGAPSAGYEAWGWKIPEMMFSIPEMRHTFSAAKFVHLIRHPISLCMRRTHTTSRIDNVVGREVLGRAYASLGLDINSVADRADSFNNAVSWVYQVGPVIEFAGKALSGANYLQLKYEDIIGAQGDVMERLCRFIGLNEIIRCAPIDIDPARTNFDLNELDQQEIADVWSLCGPLAESLGYQKDLTHQQV